MPCDNSQTRAAAIANSVWVLVGPGALSILAIIIVETGRSWLSLPSILFLAVLLGMAAARWSDPMNSDGTRITPSQRSLYVFLTMTLGLIGWVVTNLASDHWAAS
jgi:hypothetical protein